MAVRWFITALLVLPLFNQPIFPYSSEPDFLLAEFWVELVPALDESAGGTSALDAPKEAFEGEIFPMQAAPLAREDAVRRLLEEAIFVFSGMIYGFRLDYTPLDRDRQVEEYFSAEPVAQIPWGDPHLHALETWRIEDKLYARIRYDLSPDQLRRREAWSSAVHEAASASAIAPLNLGYKGRMEAHRLAIREAFRNHLRSIERNKPRSTFGRCVIDEAPITSLSAGGYRSTIRIRLDVEEVNPYRR